MSLALPTEVQTNIELYNLNEHLKFQRGQLNFVVAKLATGVYSAKSMFSDLIDEMDVTLNSIIILSEKVMVPEANFQDFLDGLTTLDVYGSFDMLYYYNGVRKLSNYLNGIRIALIQLQDVPTKPVVPTGDVSGDFLETLSSTEFIEQGFDSPVYDDTNDFYYYTISDGDTLQTIANKVFDGDTNRWPEIAELNQISDNDLIDGDLTGETIKIPSDISSGVAQNENNLVYEAFFDGTNQELIEQFTYGQDLKLTEKHFEISATGDLRRISGIACYVQNIQSRFHGKKGTLNPSAEDWGIDDIKDDGNIPPVIALDRMLIDMEGQTEDDGRTLSASALRRTINKTGDRLDVNMEILLIGGRSITENFNTSL